MANFTPTNLLSGIAKVSEKYLNGEWRMPNTAALSTAFLGEKTMPSLAALRTREDRATYYDFPIRKAAGTATERLYNHTGNRTDSLRTQLAWKTVVDTFSISEKQLDNNSFSFDEAFAYGLKSCIFNNLVAADDWYITQLLANVTQINHGGVRGIFNTDSDIMELDSDQINYWKEQIEANLNNNDFMGEKLVIADSLAFMDMVRSLNQGAGNATNLAYQFGSGNIVPTSKTLYSGYNGSALAMPADMSGLFFWIPKQNRKPLDEDKALSYNGDKGTIQVPVVDDKGNVAYNIDAAIHMYAQRADTSTSSENGSKQDIEIEVEVSWDMGFMAAPLSSLRATDDWAGKTDSVIYSFGLKADGGA
jgi:hypothetical protein